MPYSWLIVVFCRSILPKLEEAGVIGLIEPINPWSLPDYNLDSYNEALKIIKYEQRLNIVVKYIGLRIKVHCIFQNE